MPRNLHNWEVADHIDRMMKIWKDAEGDTPRLEFIVQGANVEADNDGHRAAWGVFESFTIDGRAPSDEEEDEYSDDLRALIRQAYLDL